MESLNTEICSELEKRDGRGRRILGRDYWMGLLASYDRSGLTQKQFCRSEGVNYHTFVNWLARRKRSDFEPTKLRFQKLSIEPEPVATTLSASSLEVSLPCGTVLRGSNASTLADLVRLLSD